MKYEVRRVYLHRNEVHVQSRALDDATPLEDGYSFDGYGVFRRDANGALTWFRDTPSLSDAVQIASIANAQ
jgi:hypothetical protein